MTVSVSAYRSGAVEDVEGIAAGVMVSCTLLFGGRLPLAGETA